MSAVVVPFHGSHGVLEPVQTSARVSPVLDATLAFEAVVDAVVAFEQRRRQVPAGDVSPVIRARYRAALARTLNDLDAVVREAADTRCAAGAARTLAGLVDRPLIDAFVTELLDDYRRALSQVPLRGVGTFI